MKALLIAALAIVGNSVAYADGAAGTLPLNTLVTSQGATVTAQTACTANNLIASQRDGSFVYCKDHKWTVNQANTTGAVEIENASAADKNCSLNGVTITGKADIRCTK
jgi:hypothetical protein